MTKRVIMVLALLSFATGAAAQTPIDCDAPAPAAPAQIRTGQPYTVAFCMPATVEQKNAEGTVETVAVRIDGFTGQLDAQASVELGQLTLGPPAPTTKLAPVSFRTTAGVPKGNHAWTIQPWNCPLATDGVTPDCSDPARRQKADAVSIPFVGSDPVLSGAPPPIQKGRISK
jgi:hypothetical protein